MVLFQIMPGEAKRAANELESLRQSDMELIRKSRAAVMSLNEVWKGTAEEAYVNKFLSQENSIAEFHNMLKEFVELLQHAADQAESVDSELLSIVNRIQG